jgi:histone H2A
MPPKQKKNSPSGRKSKLAGTKGRVPGQVVVSGASRAGLIFAPARATRVLREGRYSSRCGASAGVFMAGVLEYLTSEVLELAVIEMESMKNKSIQPKHINLAFRSDQELGQLMHHAVFTTSTVPVGTHPFHLKGKAAKDH